MTPIAAVAYSGLAFLVIGIVIVIRDAVKHYLERRA